MQRRRDCRGDGHSAWRSRRLDDGHSPAEPGNFSPKGAFSGTSAMDPHASSVGQERLMRREPSDRDGVAPAKIVAAAPGWSTRPCRTPARPDSSPSGSAPPRTRNTPNGTGRSAPPRSRTRWSSLWQAADVERAVRHDDGIRQRPWSTVDAPCASTGPSMPSPELVRALTHELGLVACQPRPLWRLL